MRTVTVADAQNVIFGLQDEIRRSQEARYDHRLHGVLYQSNGVYSTTFLTLVRPVLGWPPWQDPGHYWTPTAKRPKWPRGSKVNRPAGGASGSWPSSLGWRAS